MPRSRPAAATVLVLSAALLASSCSRSSYDEVDLDGLGSGPCAGLVPTLQDIGAGLGELADGETDPRPAAKRFATAQDALTAQRTEPPVGPAVTELVTRLGFYRVAVDSNGDHGAESTRVRDALAALAETCRTA